MSRMRIGSLCSGYGGLDMAVESVFGGSLAWVSDIDPGACKVLAHRFPDVPNLGDMTAVDWGAVEPVDVLCGGTPCQDLSHAGKRAGMSEGTRSNQWVAMREAIAQLRPSVVVWENVRGAYSASADSAVESCPGCVGDDPGVSLRALGRVVGDLAELGMDARWHGLRAADVGAPHGRHRVFVVAYPAAVSPHVGHERGGRAWVGRPGPADGHLLATPTRSIAKGGRPQDSKGKRDLRLDLLPTEAQRLLPTPTAQDSAASGGSTPSNVTLTDAVVRTELGSRPNPRLLPTPRGTVPEIRTSERAKRLHSSSDSMGDLVAKASWGDYAPAIARWERILGREAPLPTEPAPKGGQRLSPRFVEWLMGLPDGWVTDVPGVTRNEALRLCGNGVVPQQAEAALREMLSWEAVA